MRSHGPLHEGRHKGGKVSRELRINQQVCDKTAHGLVIVSVGVRLGGVDFRFADHLLYVCEGAFDLEWPSADQRLIQQVLRVAVRPPAAPVTLVQRGPVLYRLGQRAEISESRCMRTRTSSLRLGRKSMSVASGSER
jgi:hypothetical protein